jgi:hypothetical protein
MNVGYNVALYLVTMMSFASVHENVTLGQALPHHRPHFLRSFSQKNFKEEKKTKLLALSLSLSASVSD